MKQLSLKLFFLFALTVFIFGSANNGMAQCTYTVPYSGNNSIVANSGTICDHGGVGNYLDNANGYTVINPVSGFTRLTFTAFQTESGWDYVTVFDGVGVGGTQLFNGSGAALPPVLTSTTGALTLRFTSDGSITGAGFSATISNFVVTPPSISGFTPSSGCAGGVSVVITGANFTGATGVSFGGVPAQSFVVNNNNQITAIPGAGATGVITVTTPSGSGSSVGIFTVNPSPAAPNPVTANPSTICAGSSTDLNAISVGNTINWFTTPSGGVALTNTPSGVNYSVSPAVSTIYYAESVAPGGGVPVTFNYTGSVQTYTVPVGVTSINIDARGAQGGGSNGGAGGLGARMVGDYPVTPGTVLNIVVGQQGLLQVGGNAQNSSGGGGGTFVYTTGPNTLLVAAGGGGGKCNYTGSGPLHPGAAGSITTNGNASSDGAGLGGVAGNGGGAGLWSGIPCAGGGTGWLSNGGGPYGGLGFATWVGGPGFCGGAGGGCGGVGGFGGGGGGGNHYGGGGGGGGYSGGGGGTDPTHGGGGGSFSSGTGQANVAGFQLGNGQVIITPQGTGCVSNTRTPISVSVLPIAAAPNPVTATPSTICANGTSQLNSTATPGSTQTWYTVPSGGVAIGTSLSGANFPVSPAVTTTYYVETFENIPSGSQTFNYTGGVQTFTVPAGINSLDVDVQGAKGGTGFQVYSTGGNGGRVTGTIAVTPGQVLNIYVGGMGGNGSTLAGGVGGYNGGGAGALYPGNYAGGGGGGASDIRVAPYNLNDRLAVAGGGGGGAFDYSTAEYERGGLGGGLIGGGGYHANILLDLGYPGDGGTQVAGGTAGNFPGYCVGNTGALGIGGAGGFCTNSGGGGGGGYYGGGGGVWGGGGGGSSFLAGGVHTQGFQSGNGQVIISWTGSVTCPSNPRVPVTVTVSSPTVTASASVNPLCEGSSTILTGGGAVSYIWTGGVTDGVSFAPLATNTYTVTGTDGGGCTATSSITVTVDPLAPGPSPVTATPSVICIGGNSDLNAVSVGNTINWYTVPSGGVAIGTVPSGTNLNVTPAVTTTYYAETQGVGPGGSQTFNYTGSMQTFTVPPGVTSVTINAFGAQGGGSEACAPPNQEDGGLGGNATGTLAVTPGQVLNIFVGQKPAMVPGIGQPGGYNGGGASGQWAGAGGGASDVRVGGTALGDRVIVAGGGGGGNTGCPEHGAGGNGGGLSGDDGTNGGGGFNPGGGGSQIAGGFAGTAPGAPGSLGIGGGSGQYHEGGGGGGYYGGGSAYAAGGGGGSSYIGGVTGGATTSGVQTGNGQVIITWSGAGSCPSVRVPVTVTVDPIPVISVSASSNPICEGDATTLTASGLIASGTDQSQLISNTCMANFNQTDLAQSFIPSSNTICGAGVYLESGGSGTVTIQLYTNLPNAAGVLLASGSAVGTSGSFVDVTWPSVPVSIGTTYYLVFTSTNGGQCIGGDVAGGYANGQLYANPGYGAFPGFDYTFRTATCGGTYTYDPGALSGAVQTVSPAVTTTYTVTGTSPAGCTSTATITVNVNAAPVVNATATPSTTCNLTSVNPCATGAVSYVWTGGLSNCTPFVATTTDTYTVTGTDGAGCTGTSSVTVTVTPASGVLAPTTSNQSQDHGDDFNINYYAANCDLIATVDDGAGGNVLGLTTSTVNVDATASFHNGQPFVRRWYQITPTTNGSADVKLYINQTDFDDYNAAVVAPYLPLPTGPGDASGIANIRITKNDDGGLGNNPIVITPAVSWNGTYWELSFNTPSFSQFRVHSVNPGNVPLPVTVTSFSGTKLESSDKLSWITSSEQNNAYFNLQHSTDGISFSTIAKVASKAPNGNSNTALSYTATNNKPALGHNYYRLQQVDIDNKVSVHAQIVDLIWGANGSTVSIYPNPTTDILNIDLYATSAQNTTVKLLDMSGRVIRQVQAKSAVGMNNIQLSLGEIASGVYTVQVYENNHLTHTSKVKKND